MKTCAALFHAPGVPLEVREIDLAEPRADEVLVRIAAVGICGTDLHVVKGDWQRPTPMVLGHEGSGVVEAIGADVEGLAPGDHIVLSWAPSCGDCADCRRGSPAACLTLQRAIGAGTLLDGTTGMSFDGKTVYRGTATGALSERLVVPQKAALALTADVRLEEAALLGCAALTGVGAVLFVARPEPGSTALVIGAGGVGQFVVQGARIADAAAIIAVDAFDARRERARQLGATHAVPPEDLRATMEEVAPDGVNVAFDAVGDPQTSALALRWTRNGGTTVLVGLPAAGARLDLDPAELTRREKILTGTMYGSEDPAIALPVLLGHVRAGRLDLASLVGPTYPLEQVNEAIAASLSGSPGRVLVAPQAERNAAARSR